MTIKLLDKIKRNWEREDEREGNSGESRKAGVSKNERKRKVGPCYFYITHEKEKWKHKDKNDNNNGRKETPCSRLTTLHQPHSH